ncbi:porin [Rhizobium sp. C4]|uniref:porin n=1 Tax=Rhizobium sp. C4 TaxID=1349800 RepID=UPI001E34F173|nr:porin [Rhizobium sp. C4]MCD2171972.1 porin [Rhizobium sp. C4]
MNIKSLLLGSATAFAVVSGAQAADAIVAAAPEPMEYVKVCDAFGTGYFYIPGTETCLKISGGVRYQLQYSSIGGVSTANPAYRWSSYNGDTRLFLDAEARNSTEIGTVYSWLEIRGSANGTYSALFKAGIDAGAAGFEVGYGDSYWSQWTGFGGYGNNNGDYGYVGSSYAAFYGKAGNVSYFASVDDFTNTAGKTAGLNGGVKATFGTVGVGAAINYDIAAKSFGAKGFVEAKFDPITLKVQGIYASNASNAYAPAKGFTLYTAAKAQLTSNLAAYARYSYEFTPKTYQVAGGVEWNVANGFMVRPEVGYTSSNKAVFGNVRFQRSF